MLQRLAFQFFEGPPAVVIAGLAILLCLALLLGVI
jgi:hypothetical protein